MSPKEFCVCWRQVHALYHAGTLPRHLPEHFDFFCRQVNIQVAAPDYSNVTTPQALCMLRGGPCLVVHWEFSNHLQEYVEIFWTQLKSWIADCLLQGSHLRSFVNDRHRSIRWTSKDSCIIKGKPFCDSLGQCRGKNFCDKMTAMGKPFYVVWSQLRESLSISC